MKMNDNQHFYSAISKDGSTSQLKVYADKVTASVTTKCPVCQEHHDILGLTDAFNLHLQEDILFLKNESVHKLWGLPEDAFKIKYCPMCGRKL